MAHGDVAWEGAPTPPQKFFFIFGSQNTYFGAFSGPSRVFLQCNTSRYRPDLHYACPLWHSRLTVARSKVLEFLQKRVLNIIFPDSEYMTNLIISNVETLSHDDSYTLTAFLQTVISLGGHGPLPPSLWIRHCT